MKIVDKVKARMELEQFNTKLEEVRAALGDRRKAFSDIAREHMNVAYELHDEAIAAMKYNPSQTLHVLKVGWVHLDIAYTVVKSAQLTKLPPLPTVPNANEAEDKIGYLSSTLARIKAMIEYSNCWVSDFARTILDGAMDYYQRALSALEGDYDEEAIRAAQAGLLKVSLASELIRAENSRALPGWTGLSNPMLASPLRRTLELTNCLVQTRVLLNSIHEPEATAQFNKIMHKYDKALESLASGDIDHAQATITKLLLKVDDVRNSIGEHYGEDGDQLLDEYSVPALLEQAGHVELVLSELNDLINVSDFDGRGDLLRKRYELKALLESISFLYTDAIKSATNNDLPTAEQLLATGLFNLDLLRQRLFGKGPAEDLPF
ncbi:MAG: hypothetical protein U0105_14915 [Candidatus Obscuribacterales bacterium]